MKKGAEEEVSFKTVHHTISRLYGGVRTGVRDMEHSSRPINRVESSSDSVLVHRAAILDGDLS